ncbi:unnamed protein product, partial [Nesidiocoris tenuis]
MAQKNDTFPTFNTLSTFVRERCVALQLAEGSREGSSNSEKTEFSGKLAPPGYQTRSKTRALS